MKRRTHASTLLAATTAALLLPLAACGGSDDSSDEIEGVGEGGNEEEQSESPSPDTSEDGAARPEIVLPDDLQLVFEGWESNDPEEQAVLDDGSERLRSVFAAASHDRDPAADHVLFYHAEGEALESAQYWIEGFTEYDLTITGTIRYLEPELVLNDEESAVLNYCADESEASAVYVDSGEPYEETSDPYLFYSTNLEKDERGVWVTTNVTSQREDCTT